MADEADQDDELLLTDELDADEPDQADIDEQDDEEEEETLLTFDGDEEPKDGDSSLIKHLRQQLKEARKPREASTPVEPIEVGEKPTIAGCEYDEERYEQELDEWRDRKAAADSQRGKATQASEDEQRAWQAELDRYNEGKSKLGFNDVDDAEETIKASFDPVQQAVLIKATNDPAKVMYALAKHPDRLAAITSIRDPLKLAAALAVLEKDLKVVKRRKAPDPEKIERGSGKVSKSNDRTLAKLESEAERTGDRTELVAYKSKMKGR